MYCSKCGTRNDDTATTCIQCGNALPTANLAPPPPPQAQPPQAYPPTPPIAQAYAQVPPPVANIPNYLVQAILVTFFCCLPLGIVSIIFAAQVNSKLAAGDVQGAMEASRQAKLFAWIAFGLGAVFVVIYGLFFFLGIAASIARHAH